MMKTFLIIDTFNFLHRAYHALPNTFRDVAGEPTNAVYGVSSMLINVLDTIRPHYVVSALDSKEPNFRVEQLVTYKAHRKPMEDDLSVQIPKVIEVMEAFGIKNVVISGYEADDIIGTLVKKFGKEAQLLVISNDRDLWQLTPYGAKIMVPDKNGSFIYIDTNTAKEKYQLDPSQIIDYKGLRGDPSDNIPGVYGIGDKTAKDLLQKFGTIENIYKNIDDVKPESVKKKLVESYEQALLSKKLATIDVDAPLTIDLKECVYSDFNRGRVKELFERYNFKSLIKRLGFDPESGKSKKEKEINDNQLSLL